MKTNDEMMDYIKLVPYEQSLRCPNCIFVYPKLRLPLLEYCPSCRNISQKQAMDALVQQAQELNMGYEKSDYPSWICSDCAKLVSCHSTYSILATFHEGICDVCLKEKSVTEPRDYGYPDVKIGQFSTRGVNE